MLVVSSLAASGLRLTAATTCAAVLVIAPEPLVARLTVTVLPDTLTVSGALAVPWLTSDMVTLLPPSEPHAVEVTETVLAAAVPNCVCALVAVRLVRQVDQLGQLRELRGQAGEPGG